MHSTSARDTRLCTCVGAGVSLLCLFCRQVGVFAPCRSFRVSVTLTNTVSHRFVMSAGFSGRRIPRQAHEDPRSPPRRDGGNGMADPGLLAAHPRADAATLGLQGSHRCRLHGKSTLTGETPNIWVLVVCRYVHTLLLFLQLFILFLPAFPLVLCSSFLCLLPSFALGYFLCHGWLRNGL